MPQDEQPLILTANGTAFEGGKYDLRKVDAILSNYRSLLDHSLALTVGHKTLPSQVRDQVIYQIEFRNGSLEVLLRFLLEHPEAFVAAAALSSDGGYQIAEKVAKLIELVVKFRRAWARLWEEKGEGGSTPSINLNVNIQDVTVTNGTINVNPVILPAAEATKGALDKLVSSIDGQSLESVRIRYGSVDSTLVHSDASMLGTQKEELPSSVDVIGRLYEVNFQSKRGLMNTSSGRVPVSWEERIRDDIHRLADREDVMFRVRPIIDRRRFKDAPVGYHVLKCWIPQQSLLRGK